MCTFLELRLLTIIQLGHFRCNLTDFRVFISFNFDVIWTHVRKAHHFLWHTALREFNLIMYRFTTLYLLFLLFRRWNLIYCCLFVIVFNSNWTDAFHCWWTSLKLIWRTFLHLFVWTHQMTKCPGLIIQPILQIWHISYHCSPLLTPLASWSKIEECKPKLRVLITVLLNRCVQLIDIHSFILRIGFL